MRRILVVLTVALVMAAMMLALAMPAFAAAATVFIPSKGCDNAKPAVTTPFNPRATLLCSPTTPP